MGILKMEVKLKFIIIRESFLRLKSNFGKSKLKINVSM
jgi:hypothetical protein